MATAEIFAGICGFHTTVEANKTADGNVDLHIESECKAVCRLAESVPQVDPLHEFSWRRDMPLVLQLAPKCLSHPACPVPSGIIKAIEVEAGLALPADVSIKIAK